MIGTIKDVLKIVIVKNKQEKNSVIVYSCTSLKE